MAITIKNPKRGSDKSESTFLGLKLPLMKSNSVNGYFESTSLTLDAVKENIRSLLLTRKGERLFNPGIGIGLEELLFEQVTEDTSTIIDDTISQALTRWLPFVSIYSIDVFFDDGSTGVRNGIKVEIEFFINSSPEIRDSVSIEVKQ
jgi:phage baseplate assembly protein W